METLPVKPHRVWSLSFVLLPPCLSSAVQLTGLQIRGSARMVLGQSLAGGSEEVTLEATLCLGFSPETLPRGRNVAWSWSRVTWKASQACVWQLIKAQEKWAAGGSFHCVSSSRACGACPHCGSQEACKPVTRGWCFAGSSAGSQKARLGLHPGPMS